MIIRWALGLLTLPILLGLPGAVAVRALFGPAGPLRSDGPTRVFLAVAASVLLTGWLGFTLAEMGGSPSGWSPCWRWPAACWCCASSRAIGRPCGHAPRLAGRTGWALAVGGAPAAAPRGDRRRARPGRNPGARGLLVLGAAPLRPARRNDPRCARLRRLRQCRRGPGTDRGHRAARSADARVA